MKLDDATFMRLARGDFDPKSLIEDRALAERCSDTADMRQNLWLLYSLAVGICARDMLEVGANDGTSTLALLKAAHETDGRVLSVDVVDVPHARAIVGALELGDRWEFRLGDSRDVLPALRADGCR